MVQGPGAIPYRRTAPGSYHFIISIRRTNQVRVIDVDNVNQAWPLAVRLLQSEGVPRESRYGPVLEHPEPVTTVYRKPWQRVLFDEVRDANPFFHFFESLWMLGGRND